MILDWSIFALKSLELTLLLTKKKPGKEKNLKKFLSFLKSVFRNEFLPRHLPWLYNVDPLMKIGDNPKRSTITRKLDIILFLCLAFYRHVFLVLFFFFLPGKIFFFSVFFFLSFFPPFYFLLITTPSTNIEL